MCEQNVGYLTTGHIHGPNFAKFNVSWKVGNVDL